jgi:RimJ/RimL family protein N-acetyltransferase
MGQHGLLHFCFRGTICARDKESFMELNLGDLRVRSWRQADLDALVRHANNPKIAGNLRDQFPHPYSRRDGIDYLNYVRDMEVETSFAVEYAGGPIGGVGFLLGADIARISAEIGYWLSEIYWGRGLATRVVQGISDWAFDNYKLTRIFAMAFSYNVGSMRVLEKAGFVREGVMRKSAIKNGVVLDQVLYAKVR